MTRILHLTLHRKWFDQIALGRKHIEYRERKPYWKKRLGMRVYDEVHFRNGYAANAPFMRVEWKGFWARYDYEIHLGDVLEIKNWPGSRGAGK